jgi:hypothetical protein
MQMKRTIIDWRQRWEDKHPTYGPQTLREHEATQILIEMMEWDMKWLRNVYPNRIIDKSG